MSLWAELIPAAMVGTARQMPPLPGTAGEIGETLQAAHAAAPAAAGKLLGMAAVLATCGRAAGPQPAPGEYGAAADSESLPAIAEPALLALLPWLLQEAPLRLQQLVFIDFAGQGRRLPYAMLPAALELARANVALREFIQPLLGARGRWLAGQNPAWRFAAGVGESAPEAVLWSEGSTAQRCALLRAERQRDPAAGRERLVATLAELHARERGELLAELIHGLQLADEPLLLDLLRDRAREVRDIARTLLLRLPDGEFAARAGERMAVCLHQERRLLRKVWLLEAPEAFVPAWANDGLVADRPKNDSLGERAWWLYQLARQLAPGWWCAHTGLSPEALLHWAQGTDWVEALLRAWRETLLLTADAPWVEAMLAVLPAKLLPPAAAAELLALLPCDKREKYWLASLRELPETADPLLLVLPKILVAHEPGAMLSAGFSADLLAHLVAHAERQTTQAYQQRLWLLDLSCIIHPTVLPQLLDVFGPSLAGTPWLHAFEQLLRTRQALGR